MRCAPVPAQLGPALCGLPTWRGGSGRVSEMPHEGRNGRDQREPVRGAWRQGAGAHTFPVRGLVR